MSAPEQRQGDWIQTYTGRAFWPMDPRPNEVCIEDIAHSLSMQCRYAGHCSNFYSVAEHSILVAQWVRKQTDVRQWALAALLHDATEAYLVDVPRPVKPHLIGYHNAESRLWDAIAKRFKLAPRFPDIVHEADDRILIDERDQNMLPSALEWNLRYKEPLGVEIKCLPPKAAEWHFLRLFNQLHVDSPTLG